MLTHGDGLGAPEEKASNHSRDRHCSEKEEDEQQDIQQKQRPRAHSRGHQSSEREVDIKRQTQRHKKPQEGQDDLPSLPAPCEESVQGTGGHEARRRRRLEPSSPGPESHAPESTAKRKRTPSRRVVEAAESALLLEEVMASEDLAARSAPSRPSRFPADYRDAPPDDLASSYLEAYGGGAACFGETTARVGALSVPVHENQRLAGSSDLYRALEFEENAKDWEPQTGSRKGIGPGGAQRHLTAVAEEIPLYRRPCKVDNYRLWGRGPRDQCFSGSPTLLRDSAFRLNPCTVSAICCDVRCSSFLFV